MNRAQHQRGAAAAEFVVVFLSFAALITGLFEMTRVYRAKHTLNTATFQAARAGAVHHGRAAPMESELANNMAPLFMGGERSVAGLNRALLGTRALVELPGIGVEIVSPSRAAFDQLRKRQWLRLDDDSEHRWQDVIPNDNLRFRPREVADIEVDGNAAALNLQDANLLKIRSLWCHRLIVPALDHLIFGILNQALFVSERQLVCSAISGRDIAGIAAGFYIAVVADATVRMQSAVVADSLR